MIHIDRHEFEIEGDLVTVIGEIAVVIKAVAEKTDRSFEGLCKELIEADAELTKEAMRRE